MRNFLTESRFFSKKLDIRMPALYLLDLLLIPFVICAYLVWLDMRQFNGANRTNEVSAHSFALMGVVGIYGLRISTWIAILRKNRMPQTLEWLATLIGLGVVIFCIIFSAQLTEAYAGAHGYRLCGPIAYHREVTLMFAKRGVACPPPPPLKDRL